ncbi:DUF2961 domain-containing protein [Cellulophaga sp. F20128]|uniref:glycoside hydrolase family 172 protein n=1 Tax=Cellulophaga sp. F20128 TaxID=2926413 RepID=UPI001FF6B1CA|nr:glycoside hydrolase family 172 protein [Cellulophaga sp. F20128]MCK0156318.1 DUF2961 domain-containing protein [Cellulophaga sp. F20128]
MTKQKNSNRKLKFFGFTLAILLVISSCREPKENRNNSKEVTMEGLLKEMIDRDQITNFPENNYQLLQASSYNRASVSPEKPGWFADSDGESFIRVEENNGKKEWVIMEDEGPGAITKIWAVCFYYGLNDTIGANIKIYLDGAREPTIATNFFELVKGADFVKAPLADYSTRAGNLYLPIPYAKSCKITMDKKAFYNIINYRKYKATTKVKTFTMQDFEQAQQTIAKVSKTLVQPPAVQGEKVKERKLLKSQEALTFNLPAGNRAVQEIRIKLSNTVSMAQALRSTVVGATFDGEETVWVPVGDFFNNVGKIEAYDMWERSVSSDGTMVCRWVMPYEKSAQISITNLDKNEVEVAMEVVTDDKEWEPHTMHFYATWQMEDPTPTFPLYDWNFLTANGKGVIVGDQWTVLNPIEGWWGEGDEKIYVDDDVDNRFPSHFGTGTEDYYGWAGGVVPTPEDQFSKPFLGNIIVGEKSKGYNVCTRTRVLDAIPFQQQIIFDIESSCGKRSKAHFLQYAQTTFWYGIPGVTHNKKQLPQFAAATLPTVSDLEKLIKTAEGTQYMVDNALEAELLLLSKQSKSVVENFAEIPMWGEMSGGALKNIWFEKLGDFIEIKITEQFEASHIKIGTAVGPSSGSFDVYVNGNKKISQDLYAKHNGISNPYLDLGSCDPVDNAFVIRFQFTGSHQNARDNKNKYALGLDFFLIKNNFLKRSK